jgi:hypothetical protein
VNRTMNLRLPHREEFLTNWVGRTMNSWSKETLNGSVSTRALVWLYMFGYALCVLCFVLLSLRIVFPCLYQCRGRIRIWHYVFHYCYCLVKSILVFININLLDCSCNCFCCSCKSYLNCIIVFALYSFCVVCPLLLV